MEGEGKVERGAAIRGGAMGEGVMWNNDGGRGGLTWARHCVRGWAADIFGGRGTLFRGRWTFSVGGGCFR